MSRVRLDTLREEVVSMRARMRRELDRSEAGRFDLKHGRGGIGDIEFVVQYLVLLNARNFPAVIRFSDNIRQIAALAAVGRLDVQTAARLQDAYREFRRRLHHLTLNDRPPFVGDDELLAERDLVCRSGQCGRQRIIADPGTRQRDRQWQQEQAQSMRT
jgi:glutamate-ammonia-ligase adenylyltransferase